MYRLVAALALAGCVVGPDPGGGGVIADAAPGGTVADARDLSAPDGGADAAASSGVTCADPGLLFCDDFEDLAPGPATSARWTPETANGEVTIDGTHARGARALHVHTTGNGRGLIRVNGFAPPANSFYARAHVWVDGFPSAPDYAHFTMVELAGNGGGVVRPIGGQYIPSAGKSLWGVGSDGGATGDWTRWQTTAPAEGGKWVCLEWQLAATDNAINVWIDGVAHPEMGVTTKDHGGSTVDFVFPSFTSIWFGWWLYQGGPTPGQFDVWFDDIAVGASRLGC
ncbi:MAG: hypothetical protein K8W52_26885 [Deltaproteobacteria bacterium]|nr:hypothetical protein [Deltaproteobacteria bacterium]